MIKPDLIKPGELSKILKISPRVLCDITEDSIEDTKHHNGNRRLYTLEEAAIVWIALDLRRTFGWKGRRIRKTLNKLITRETDTLLLKAWIGADFLSLTVHLQWAMTDLEQRLHLLARKG